MKLIPNVFNKAHLEKQSEPFFIFYKKKLEDRIEFFINNFDANILYAVKANPSKIVIKILAQNGIKSFDVASLNEMKVVKKIIPDSHLFYMNPVKPRNFIRESYFNFNVKDFAIDSLLELKKIEQETNYAKDIKIHLRIKLNSNNSFVDLSEKFGVEEKEAPKYLREISKQNFKVGICFHVGSQCMNSKDFKSAIKKCKKIIHNSGVEVSSLDIGGGFPSSYPKFKQFSLSDYFKKIHKEFSELKEAFKFNIKLYSEPGRSIVSDCMSLIVRVDLKKNNRLFINDGIYGFLNNAGFREFNYHVKLFNRIDNVSKLKPFRFFGPTCDSADFMKGPFYLPSSVKEGDWIEIKQMGAYSITMKTDFNGFFEKPQIYLDK